MGTQGKNLRPSMMTVPTMIDTIRWQMVEDLVARARRMRGEQRTPSGFVRWVDSTVKMEEALARITKGQVLQTNALLDWLVKQTVPVPPVQLANWLEASNRWLEAMVLLHWLVQSRLRRIFPYLPAECLSRNDERMHAAILEAQLHTLSASASLAEVQLQLVAQFISRLQQHPARSTHPLDKLEKAALLLLGSVEEMLRLLLRKQDPWAALDQEQMAAISSPVREASVALLASVKKLEGQRSTLPLFSREFIDRLKETVTRLIRSYGASSNGSPPVFRSEPPFPKPWLNEEIFGIFPKERKKK